MHLYPTRSTQYYLNCVWKNEKKEMISRRAASKVIVTQHGKDTTPKQVPFRSPSIISFSAEPLTVQAGERVTVYWNAKDGDVCMFAANPFIGLSANDIKKRLPLSGSDAFIPLKSARYGITCAADTYARGEFDLEYTTTARDEEWTDIIVIPPQESTKKEEQKQKDIAISFTTNKDLVPKGKTAFLEWNAVNATSCMPKGPKWWKSTRPSKGSFEIRPDYSATYQLQCINDFVSPPIKKTASLSIDVVPSNEPSWLKGNTTQKPLIEFKSNRTQLQKKGAVIFSWTASYAESCRGEGGASVWRGKKKSSGTHTLYPQWDSDVAKPYTLICSNRNGTTISQEIRLSFAKAVKKK